ncbi:MAG: hypothetical protein IJO91_05320 [Oscillospiraceae bacterium]|nr:hypothetical protein [Oscillospiraceae bacterium]
MPEPRSKLPRSVIVLNIIMIVLIFVICGLVVSLLYSDAVMGERETTAESTISTPADQSAGTGKTTTSATTTTTPKSSVSMTKRSTEPTEPVSTPTESVSDTPSQSEPNLPEDSTDYTDYSQTFFADDLFIGDSITTGIYLYNKLDMKNVAASVGYTPYKAYTEEVDLYDGTSSTALEYAEKLQPKRIYIMLGSNGLFAASAMEDSYRTLINKLSAACPDSYIYCISVSPVAKNSSLAASGGITNDMVVEFNSFIKGLCSELGIRYIDFYSQIIDENGYFLDKYAENDGLHFKGTTYDVMLGYIQKTIQ